MQKDILLKREDYPNLYDKEYVDFIDNLDMLDKLSIYMHYYCIELYFKYRFWESPIYDFHKFISKDRLEIRDNGKDWRSKGMGGRYWTEYYGIYLHYRTFKEELKLNTCKKCKL